MAVWMCRLPDIEAILLFSFPQSCLRKFLTAIFNKRMFNPISIHSADIKVLLVWSRDWRSSVHAIPFITKASRILTATATFSRRGLFTKNIESPRNYEYPNFPRYCRLTYRWKFTDAASVLHVVAVWEDCDNTVLRNVGKYSPVDTAEYQISQHRRTKLGGRYVRSLYISKWGSEGIALILGPPFAPSQFW